MKLEEQLEEQTRELEKQTRKLERKAKELSEKSFIALQDAERWCHRTFGKEKCPLCQQGQSSLEGGDEKQNNFPEVLQRIERSFDLDQKK